MNTSIIKKFFFRLHLFGFVVGAVFPVYSSFFVNYKSSTHKVIFIAGAVLAGTLIGSFAYYLTKKMILDVVKKIAYDLKEIESNNNLEISINIKSEDEIGLLADSADSFVKKIRKDIVETLEYSMELDRTAIDFKSISSDMNGNSKNMEAEIIDISEYINQVKDKSKMISGDLKVNVLKEIEYITEKFITVNNEINNINNSSLKVEDMISSVSSSIDEINSTISEISANTLKAVNISNEAKNDSEITSEKMAALNESALAIGNIVELIREIANQTNLLALNATIEAARAGEAGKGFAVVANEIKNLANETNEATLNITKQISEIQKNVDIGIRSVNELSDVIIELSSINSSVATSIEEQSATISEVSRSLGQVADNTKNNTDSIGNITSEVNIITDKVQNITNKVEYVTRDSEENSENMASTLNKVENIVKISKVTSKNSDTISSSSLKIGEISQKLNNMISKFNV